MRLDISPLAWQFWGVTALVLLIAAALITDLRQRRIPNALIALGLFSGLLLQVLGPSNDQGGLLGYWPGALGLRGWLGGVLTGLLAFLPFYALRAMGAGDVKLLAAIGGFVGSLAMVNIGVLVLISGGLLAVFRMLWARNARLVMSNTAAMLAQMLPGSAGSFDPATQSADRMPYALAIACGVCLYGAWVFLGGSPLIHF